MSPLITGGLRRPRNRSCSLWLAQSIKMPPYYLCGLMETKTDRFANNNFSLLNLYAATKACRDKLFQLFFCPYFLRGIFRSGKQRPPKINLPSLNKRGCNSAKRWLAKMRVSDSHINRPSKIKVAAKASRDAETKITFRPTAVGRNGTENPL
jgi:hypothetical protein